MFLPPPLTDEDASPTLTVRVFDRRRLLPDRLLASGSTHLGEWALYSGGQHEVAVPLSDGEGRPAGRLHLGLQLERRWSAEDAAPLGKIGQLRQKPALIWGDDCTSSPSPSTLHPAASLVR